MKNKHAAGSALERKHAYSVLAIWLTTQPRALSNSTLENITVSHHNADFELVAQLAREFFPFLPAREATE